MSDLKPNKMGDLWILPKQKDNVFTLQINRNFLLTFILSIFIHLSLLWIFAPKLFSMGAPVKDAPPLEITLGPPQKEAVAPSEAVLPSPDVIQEKIPKPAKPAPKKPTPPKKVETIDVPVEVAKESEVSVQKKEALIKTIPKPILPETSPQPLPGEDMQAFIKRQKQAKLAKEGLSEQDIEAVMESNNPQSEGDRRDAKIKENLNLDGTNGVFEIRYLGLRQATFSFKGWKNNINTARLELFEVEATNGTDIKLAVIRKMIEIIRRDYDGDFNWDSRRLHRVIVLSARPKDNAALESFMVNEFFGPGTAIR